MGSISCSGPREMAWIVSGLFEQASLLHKVSREPVQLTAGPISFSSPTPSPDGKRIFVLGRQSRGELLRYDATSKQLVPFLSGVSAEGLHFSRDGTWVTYVGYPQGTLWRSKVDGSERLQLSFPPLQAALPRWSPDGKQIAFMAAAPAKPWKILVVSSEGGNMHPLTADSRLEGCPDWSPDGSRLVFGRLPTLEQGIAGTTNIHVLDLQTQQVSTLPGSEGLIWPRWSPDSRYLIATSTDSRELMLYDSTLRKWAGLVKLGVKYPNWSRDGGYVYFGRFLEGNPAIWRVRIADRKLEQVASLKELRQPYAFFYGGWFGPWSGLAPDDSPLVSRDLGSAEIYALDWEAP